MESLHLDTVGAMDAAAALADLVEISPQIEAAAVVLGEGELAGSVGIPEERAGDARARLLRPQALSCGGERM